MAKAIPPNAIKQNVLVMGVMIYSQIRGSAEKQVTLFPNLQSRANTPIEVQIIHKRAYLAKIWEGS